VKIILKLTIIWMQGVKEAKITQLGYKMDDQQFGAQF
jgi:hypothetical protein